MSGIIPLMLTMIRVKKAIDLFPTFDKEEVFVETFEFRLTSIGNSKRTFDCRARKASNQFESSKDKKRKNIIRIYKCLQVMETRNFYEFLFKEVISKFWKKETNQENLSI